MRVSRKLGRRALLRGAAGVTVGLPFLSSLGRGASAAGPETPKRIVTFYTPNGFDPAGRPTGTNLAGTVLESLSPFRDRVTTIADMSQVSRMFDSNENDGAHYHGWSHCVVGDSCWPSPSGRVAGGISYDQKAAEVLCAETRFRSINQGGPSWYGANEPVSTSEYYSPRDIYNRMFADLGADPAGLEEASLRRRSVLDFTKGSMDRLRCRLDREDQARIDSHMESVRDLERRLDASPVASCSAPAMPPEYSYDPDYRHRSSELWEEWANIKIELLSMAFACDLTRVGTVGFGGPAHGTVAAELGAGIDHHELSHSGHAADRDKIRSIERWYADKFAQLLARLDSIPADDGSSVLDHTIVLWVSEAGGSDGHSPDANHYVVAGGGIRGGQHLDMAGTAHNDLLLELINLSYPSDAPRLDTFGNRDVCGGGIPALRP